MFLVRDYSVVRVAAVAAAGKDVAVVD